MRINLGRSLTPDNQAALYHFSRTEDREPPLVFVGRDEPIEDIEYALRRSRESGTTLSNIKIVQGAPGTGKTSLLHHIAGRYEDEPTVVPVPFSGDVLTNPIAVVSGFLSACGLSANALSRAFSEKKEGRHGLRWLGMSVERGTTVQSPLEQLNNGVPIWDVLDDFLEIPTGTVFLLLIDEAQRIERDAGSEKNLVATQLHDGNTGALVVVSVFAGLSDTASQLAHVGISRPPETSVHHLDRLSPPEAEEVVAGFLDHEDFGLSLVAREDRDRLAQLLAQVSEGYPRHLHSYLRGIAKECVADNGAQIDLEKVLAHGHSMRIHFCETRLRMANLGDYQRALFNFVRDNPDRSSMSAHDLIDLAVTLGMSRADANRAHAYAIHCGVLDMKPNIALNEGAVHFPIPSFHTYMQTGGDRAKSLAALTESVSRMDALTRVSIRLSNHNRHSASVSFFG